MFNNTSEIIEILNDDEEENLSNTFNNTGETIEILNEDETNSNLNKHETGLDMLQIVESNVSEIPRNAIEDFLVEIKTLTSRQHLLILTKLSLKYYEGATELLEDHSEMISRCSQLRRLIEKTLSQTSKETIDQIFDKVKGLSDVEYSFLRVNVLKTINDNNDPDRQIPLRCAPVMNQSIMWFKTHLQISPNRAIAVQFIYQKYSDYCEKNQIKVLALPEFGKMIKRIYPNVKQKRYKIQGKQYSCYSGVQQRLQLCTPHLPKLPDITQVQEDILFSSHRCCLVYKLIHRHNKIERLQCTMEQFNQGEYLSDVNASVNAAVSHSIFSNNCDNFDDNNGNYKTGIVDGKAIIVHDPLELLSLSWDDNSRSKPHKSERSSKSLGYKIKVNYKKIAKNNSNHSKVKYSEKPQVKIVPKVKYKAYKHPSIQDVFKKYQNVILPPELYRINVSPRVYLNSNIMQNWCTENLNNFIQRLSKLIIKNTDNNFSITCTCCNDEFEITQQQAEQLICMKEKLADVTLRRTYCNFYLSDPNEGSSNSFHIKKQLSGKSLNESYCADNNTGTSQVVPACTKISDKLKNKHPSVLRIYNKFENIVLPKEIIKTDIDPVIVLDSGEVFEWYEKQLDDLKQKLANTTAAKKIIHSYEIKSPEILGRISINSSRQSKAKMMNFYESDSESDDGTFLKRNRANDNRITTRSVLNSATATYNAYKNYFPVSQVCSSTVNDNVSIQDTSQKRSLTEEDETNEATSKKIKTSCSEAVQNSPESKEPAETLELSENEDPSKLRCFFCVQEFRNNKEEIEHMKIHLNCKKCKLKFKTVDLLREHLIKHCISNNLKDLPHLQLYRVDKLKAVKYFKPAMPFQTAPQNMLQFKQRTSVPLILRTSYNKSQVNSRNSNVVNNISLNIRQIILSETPQNQSDQMFKTQNEVVAETNESQLQPIQLQNSINHNFRKNTIPFSDEHPSSIINVTSSDNSNFVHDSAVNVNASCSSSESSTNCMQMVEKQYASSVNSEVHQDHSYHQKHYDFSNENENNGYSEYVSSSTSENSDDEMPHLNNISTEPATSVESFSSMNETQSTNQSTPLHGQFRIRVKDISELS